MFGEWLSEKEPPMDAANGEEPKFTPMLAMAPFSGALLLPDARSNLRPFF